MLAVGRRSSIANETIIAGACIISLPETQDLVIRLADLEGFGL